MSGQSPLKEKPLRLPGQTEDDKIVRLREGALMDHLLVAACVFVLAWMEWFGYLTHSARHPVVFTAVAVATVAVVRWRILKLRKKVKDLMLGRDGEKVVGQQLEGLREGGAQVFHDIPAPGFNLDHVVISPHGIYAIETKTRSKHGPKERVVIEGDTLTVAGHVPDRNPIEQVTAAARWLENELKKSTGKRFFVRGVVLFPGWFVEQRGPRGDVWVLEPKALPAFIGNAPAMIASADVALAAYHLSRYVRSEAEKAA